MTSFVISFLKYFAIIQAQAAIRDPEEGLPQVASSKKHTLQDKNQKGKRQLEP
jgi:hypothetical protein